MTRFRRLKLLIMGVDPALLALRMTSCLLLSMAVVGGVMMLIDKWYPMPRATYVLALIATMQGMLQINEPTAAARSLTRVYAALAAFAAIAAISALHGSLRHINVALVIIVFAASYAARFGARWHAVGVFTFMCAVIAAFLQEGEQDLRTAAAALVVSALVVSLVRNIIMPDNPAQDFRRLVSALLTISAQLRSIAGLAVSAEGNPDPSPQSRVKDLHLAARAFNTAIRSCETALPLEAPDQDTGATGIALDLLDLQVAAEALVRLSHPAPQDARQPAPDSAERAMVDVRNAELALELAVAALPPTFPSAAGAKPPAQKRGLFPKSGEWLRDETFRRSLQVTLACAIAAILGEMISTERWFWAVISAFMIFNNSQSGAAVAVRGLDRAWGTAVGIVIGIALATLTHAHVVWLSITLAISLFVTFIIARVSYVAMCLFLTISLSLIYGLIGIFTPALLLLRLEETAIGAAAGVLVALLLFPISVQEQAATAMNGLLTALADLLDATASDGQGDRAQSTARQAAAVDRALGAIVATVGPLRTTWSLGNLMSTGRDTLRQAFIMAYAAHRLERGFRARPPSEDQAARLRAMSRQLKAAAGDETAPTPGAPPPAESAPGAAIEPDRSTTSSLAILSRMLDAIRRERQSA